MNELTYDQLMAKEAREARFRARYPTEEARREAIKTSLWERMGQKLKDVIGSKPSPCALLLGPTGCGKTSAAEYLALCVPGRTQHLRARDLANAERRHPIGQGISPELRGAKAAAQLVLDDVGCEGSDVAALQDVLDARYSTGRPVIVTTGLTMQELTNHIGSAYVRRIIDQHAPTGNDDDGEWPVLVIDCHRAK
jgi:hypothetical protein